MKILVILGHPREGSLNHAIAATVCETLTQSGHEVIFHDLCKEGFDPALPFAEIARGEDMPAVIRQHCDEVATADGIVVVHPNWWGQPPAVLKGWIDRVLRVDVAYRFDEGDNGEGLPIGLLKAQTALVFNTSNTPLHREMDVFGDPLQALWKDCIFAFCGVPDFERRMFSIVCVSDAPQRKTWLEEVREVVGRRFPADSGS